MKEELIGKVMTEMFGLRAKTYATKVDGVEGVKKVMGVKKCCGTGTYV